jgi:glycosyltransferase involved in cell wall biosynthesis
MNPKKVVVRGPALSQSGYGEHTRFVLRSLKSRPDLFEVFLLNVNWGQTGWIWENSPERSWIDSILQKTIAFGEQGGRFDLSVQVQIPNEWERIAPVNIGVTAGIESTKISSEWVQGTKNVDKIVVVSEHSKYGFANTIYEATDQNTNQRVTLKTTCPIEVVGYPVKDIDPDKSFKLKLKHKFNFLTIGTWIARKNLENTIKYFVEEFRDQDVGLIVKTSLVKNCLEDRHHTHNKLKELLSEYEDRKCEVYLLHGDLSESEMTSLYRNPKVKCLLSLTHGEGFGLPLFEAAYNGLPVIAPNWSGHCDFLYMPLKAKNGKVKRTPMFTPVSYDIKPIQQSAHWNGVLQKDSMWCFPQEWNAKKAMREVYKNHTSLKSKAKKLQKYVIKEFSKENQFKKMVDTVSPNNQELKLDYVFVADAFANQYLGGAELSLQALIEKAPGSNLLLNANVVDADTVENYKDKKWIFGNFFTLSKEVLKLFAESDVEYYVIDSDYHFCEHRLKELCMMYNSSDDCYCPEKTEHGKIVRSFLKNSKVTFFRSEEHKNQYLQKIDLMEEQVKVLTSNFSSDNLNLISRMREDFKNLKEDFWVVTSSPSFVKGATAAKAWCEANNKKYVEVHGKSYIETLQILARAQGYCTMPAGADTCPRMVIEAKLLGCELQMNENVLHSNEEWFNMENISDIEAYLKSQTDYFWSFVNDNLNIEVISGNQFQNRSHDVQC